MSNRLLITLLVTAVLVGALAWVVRADGGGPIREWFLHLHGR